jgi:DNA-binding MarR family transcriptional regulator
MAAPEHGRVSYARRPPRRRPYAQQIAEAIDDVSAAALPQMHRHVLLALALYASSDGTQCFPSVATLARRCGIRRMTLVYVLAELEKSRWIVREQRTREDGGQSSTLYTIALNGRRIVRDPRRPGT